jgi:hypothetical protein
LAEFPNVDVDAIRSQFIQENLRRAFQEPDRQRAVRTLRAFHNYFQWFESQLPDLEKVAIAGQLAKLQEAYAPEISGDDAFRASAR